ncbi:hypothetical protein RRG08_010719 [Elysia crispata]|uniref:Uncharacterized protein n=1 Tax=Elysia crispata TaxID=231223 RepID=A0AAE1A1G8_9GAST|nr:hypothetical protein RRG08_010719 [Elysia crispata]
MKPGDLKSVIDESAIGFQESPRLVASDSQSQLNKGALSYLHTIVQSDSTALMPEASQDSVITRQIGGPWDAAALTGPGRCQRRRMCDNQAG